MTVKPFNDWLQIQLDPIEKRFDNIVILREERVRTGTVLSVGPGKFYPDGSFIPTEVKVGDKVAFFREHLEHKQGKAITGSLDDGTALIREIDILFVLEPNSNVRLS